jgi:Protein of unknown function (DUF2934)
MARKTTGNTTSTRRKKTDAPVPPPAVQVALAVHNQAPEHKETRTDGRKSTDGRKNGAPTNHVPVNLASANIEEEIRRRAYELYLERRATAGGDSGDENQDWLMAENEVRSRYGTLAHHTTA